VRFTAATFSRTVRCAARECRRSFRLTSGLERRWSGGLARRALVRAQRHAIASRRRRGLNSWVVQARFGCQQLRRRGIDVLLYRRRRQQRTMVRRGDTSVRAVMAVHRDTRASVRVAPQNQQERRGEQANQGTRRCHRNVSGCVDQLLERTGLCSTDQAPANTINAVCLCGGARLTARLRPSLAQKHEGLAVRPALRTSTLSPYGVTGFGTGLPSRSSTTIGAIFVAASGPSIVLRSPTITSAR